MAFPLSRDFLSKIGNDLPSENNVKVTVEDFESDSTVKADVHADLERKYGDEKIFLLHEGCRGSKSKWRYKKNHPYK